MSLVSYAQNFEDVMLWRALKHVRQGFYIDVGANDPTMDSVTKVFYDQGWHGINIEPLLAHHIHLLRDRPRDININCAAGAETAEIEIWECDVRGWATLSSDVISRHTADGFEGILKKVPVRKLEEICQKYTAGEIHFLKVDVEGFEKAVIDGMNFLRYRPWIVVIEATLPNSNVEVDDEWKNTIISSGYILAYLDGLNHFYVASEHSELLNAFRYPPNVFDDFIRFEQANADLRAQQAAAQAEAYQAELIRIYKSRSWRITKPLRWLMQYIRRIHPLLKKA